MNLYGFTEKGVAVRENCNSLRSEAGTRIGRMVCPEFLFKPCGFQDRSLFSLGIKKKKKRNFSFQ